MQSAYASHLKFSPEFLDALANCSPFEEKLSTLNPDFATYLSPDLAKVKIDFVIKILEKKEPKSSFCELSFEQNIDKMGKSTALCQVSDEQREAFLYALKDTSDNKYSDAFRLSSAIAQDSQITVEGSLLHVVYVKILNASCSFNLTNLNTASDEFPVTKVTENNDNIVNDSENIKDENKVEPFVQYDVFSPSFMKSWQQCKPDVAEHQEIGKVEKLEIIGNKNNLCQVKFDKFDLNIPLDLMANVHSFADISALLKNNDITHYAYEPEYIYDGLIYALNSCLQKKDYDGQEKETSEADNVVIKRGMFSEYNNNQCIFHLQNELEINGQVTDYSVLCYLKDKDVQMLQPYFKEMIEKYGQKRMFTNNGKVEIHKAEFNDETRKGDIALMFYLQQKGFCKHNK